MIPSKFHPGFNYCFKCKKESEAKPINGNGKEKIIEQEVTGVETLEPKKDEGPAGKPGAEKPEPFPTAPTDDAGKRKAIKALADKLAYKTSEMSAFIQSEYIAESPKFRSLAIGFER